MDTYRKSFYAGVHYFCNGVAQFVVEVTSLRRYYFDLPQGGLEILCIIVFKGHLKEIEKVKKVLKLTESDSPGATTETIDTSDNKLIFLYLKTRHCKCYTVHLEFFTVCKFHGFHG